MLPEDRKRFIEIVDKTALIKRVQVTPECAHAWFDDLVRFDIDILNKAFEELRGEKWGFPDIADIRMRAELLQGEKTWTYTDEEKEDLNRVARAAESGRKDEALRKVGGFVQLPGGRFASLRGKGDKDGASIEE